MPDNDQLNCTKSCLAFVQAFCMQSMRGASLIIVVWYHLIIFINSTFLLHASLKNEKNKIKKERKKKERI